MNWSQSLKIFNICFPTRWKRESTAIFAGVVNQIALTGTITHLHLWWQQPGRRAKEGWFCVSWGSGSESTVFNSQKASRGNHPHLNPDYVYFCYNWSQLLPKLEAFLFWGRILLIWKWCLLCPHIWFSTFPSVMQFLYQVSRDSTSWTKQEEKCACKNTRRYGGWGFYIWNVWGFYLLCPKI